MSHAQSMLDTHPQTFDVDAGRLAEVIDALLDCANTCTQCADACLSEEDPTGLARCIRLDLDCADICATTARVVSRQTEHDANVTRPLLQACIAACRSCGEECGSHAPRMRHCSICSEQCRRCQQLCHDLLAAMG